MAPAIASAATAAEEIQNQLGGKPRAFGRLGSMAESGSTGGAKTAPDGASITGSAEGAGGVDASAAASAEAAGGSSCVAAGGDA
jgi:hypothetical protein